MYEDTPNPQDFERREAADNKLAIKFFVKPVQNDEKSAAEGRPIFDDKEYIEIRVPGDQSNVIIKPVRDEERHRFRRQYDAFKRGHEEQGSGTPLAEVPWITRSQVEELKYLKVNTLEQLAELNDGVCSRFPGMTTLKQRAQRHLELAKEAAPSQALEKFKEEMNAELAALKQTVQEQSGIIATQRKQLEAANAAAAKQ